MSIGVSQGFAFCAVIAAAIVGAKPVNAMPASLAEYRKYLTTCQAKHICNGTYIVARNGKPVFMEAFGDSGDDGRSPLTIDSSLDIGSISKQFTAMAVLRMVAERKVALDAKITSYLPAFPYAGVTVRQLLSHTSGIADAMPYYSDLIRHGAPKTPVTGADVVSVLAAQRMPARSAPGVRFAYSNTGYMVLAALVEHRTGHPFATYLEKTFFKPLGLNDTRLRTPHNEAAISRRAFGFADAPVGQRRGRDQFPGLYMLGAGGIYSTAPDLLKWANALNAGRVVPKRLLALATTPTRLLDGTTVPYGFGLGLKPDLAGNSRVSHGGHWRAFKSDLSYYPAMDVTVIQLTNNNQDDSVDANAAALATIAAGGTPPALREPIGWALAARVDHADVPRWFEAELSRQPRQYDIVESDLNTLGRAYLDEKQAARAVKVFTLGTVAFPRSAKAFDNLADAHEAAGDLKAAELSVAAALAIAPQSEAYAKRLADLKIRTH